MEHRTTTERTDTVIIGAGQAGLTMGYHLTRRGHRVIIVDANERIGDAWRKRWDSLRLFTPSHFSGLAGMALSGSAHAKPTKDEFADHLEAYAERFDLDIRTGQRVERLYEENGAYVVTTKTARYEAANVVVATGACNAAKVPSFADDLSPSITQLHSSNYRNPSQLQDGPVLIVGAGNSGADIAMDVVKDHETLLVGRHPGHVPFRIDSFKARFLIRMVRFVGQHVVTRRSPLGRKLISKLEGHGNPLVRIKPKDLSAAGVERIFDRVDGMRDGTPVLRDGRVLDVSNVIWCTGFRHGFPWIDLSIFDDEGVPIHRRGIATRAPGIYFLGMNFQFAATSETITGVDRDARYIAKHLLRARSRNGSVTMDGAHAG